MSPSQQFFFFECIPKNIICSKCNNVSSFSTRAFVVFSFLSAVSNMIQGALGEQKVHNLIIFVYNLVKELIYNDHVSITHCSYYALIHIMFTTFDWNITEIFRFILHDMYPLYSEVDND